MKNDVKNYVVEKTQELMDARSCCATAKAAARAWLDALGSENEAAATAAYLAELESDIIPVEGLLAFTGSAEGAAHFGAELAAKLHAHGLELRAAGAAHCDCPACTAAAAIVEKKAELL